MALSSNILRIDSSARSDGSVSRELGAGLDAIDGDWLGANFTPEADQNEAQRDHLTLSDTLIAEIKAAETLVISLPIYNFGIPSGLKAWIDQVARAGITFKYTPEGPVGLLEGKRAILAVASGGTEVGGPIDFATDYLKHVLGFIGIHNVQIVASDRLMVDAEVSHTKAQAALNAPAA